MNAEKIEVLCRLFASVCKSGFPRLSSPSTSRQELGKQTPLYCKRRTDLRPLNETECMYIKKFITEFKFLKFLTYVTLVLEFNFRTAFS